jgi:hypothetical protein
MTRHFGTGIPPQERRPVAWYAPRVLWQAGEELVQSKNFLRHLDRRESFVPRLQPIDLSAHVAEAAAPFWFDFLSDTGDGGSATFAVAQAALRHTLAVDDPDEGRLLLPEAELLLLGGDLAYPGASPQEYQFRFIEMFALARDPASRFSFAAPPHKVVAAIPQNHDWFDSASTFCRYFVNHDRGLLAGARTPQQQTYFAARLPHGWWVLGFDWALSGDLDRGQFEAFFGLLGEGSIGAGSDVLLVYPEPYWTRPLGDGAPDGYPLRYQRLESLIEASGARIRLRLAGDLHHYRRETLDPDPATGLDTHLVTCGSGGAFLHPTHSRDVRAAKVLDRTPEDDAFDPELNHRIRAGRLEDMVDGHLPPLHPGVAGAEEQPRYRAEACYPAPSHTRRLAWRNLWAMFSVRFSRAPWRLTPAQVCAELWDSNFGFALCLGALYGVNAYVNSFVFTRSFAADDFAPMAMLGFAEGAELWLRAMVFSPFATLINGVMIAGCLRIAWEGPAHWSGRLTGGFLHAMAHGFCVFALYWLATHALAPWLNAVAAGASLRGGLAAWLLTALGGVLTGGALFGAYLALMSGLFGQLPNNAFGSLALGSHKGFLRMRLSDDGLEVFMLGLDEVPPEARAEPQGWRAVDRFKLRKPPAA